MRSNGPKQFLSGIEAAAKRVDGTLTDGSVGSLATIAAIRYAVFVDVAIESVDQQGGHCVVTVVGEDSETVELVVTLAIRDLFVSRLDINDGESPVGERVWYRKHGG